MSTGTRNKPANGTATDAIPEGAFTERGLVLPSGLSFERWEAIGVTLHHIERTVMWWVGDWAVYGEMEYGEEYAQAISDASGSPVESVKVAQWVSERIPPKERRPEVPWTHHQAVAALDKPDRKKVLDRAKREDWNRHQLRGQVKKIRDARKKDTEPEWSECAHEFACIHCGEKRR